MDLVIIVIFCNCGIAMVAISIAIWTMRWRRRIVGLTDFCDRCLSDWNQIATNLPATTAASRIHNLRQIYQQQLGTLDRLQTLRSLFRMARFLH